MTHPDAGRLIPFVAEITPSIEQMAQGTASPTAVGGMTTKITAAKIATKSGCAVFIGSGENPQELANILNGQAEGTFFAPSGLDLNARKKWLAFFPEPKGTLQIDAGACEAILLNGRSLLARGLTEIKGHFDRAEVVEIVNPAGKTIARGISRFGKEELLLIQGKTNADVLDAFPGRNRPRSFTEIIWRPCKRTSTEYACPICLFRRKLAIVYDYEDEEEDMFGSPPPVNTTRRSISSLELNEDQFQAVTAPTARPRLGGAFGKTRTLTYRVAYLLTQGVSRRRSYYCLYQQGIQANARPGRGTDRCRSTGF